MAKIAINGLGRIGRLVYREARRRGLGEHFVCMNDLMSSDCLANLIKYDSVHRTLQEEVTIDGNVITVGGNKVTALSVRSGRELPWKEMGIDIVIESTGIFRKREELEWHLKAGAGRVILTVPPKDEIDAMVVFGVNDHILTGDEKIVSLASCTTNCAAPVLKVMVDEFGVKRCTFNTVHAYTNDQRLFDFPHSDRRRSRAAALNIIPTTTGAGKAVGPVIPELKNRVDAFAVRVPVPDGSMIDFTVITDKEVTPEVVNAKMKEWAEGKLKGILQYSEDPLVSSDVIGNPHSSVFDATMTRVFDDNMVKVLSWYDNEGGYCNRVLDMVERMIG